MLFKEGRHTYSGKVEGMGSKVWCCLPAFKRLLSTSAFPKRGAVPQAWGCTWGEAAIKDIA